jgi:tRNA A37 threonylcarbamoyladenosine biosynthesis protein TsaE
VTVVEWADRADALLPVRTVRIRMMEGIAPNERRILREGGGAS